MTSAYRADIDGLRAIAVLAILLFHINLDAFGGGYVGVDIFFVISGYLITSIIAREVSAGSFTVYGFYERRVRRILPALVLVLATTLAVGAILLDAARFADLGSSAAATSLFASNIFFFVSAGYFDGPSELKPLLHTWSLAVEEQFYIVFPLLMLLIARRFAGRFAIVLSVVAVTSFVACTIFTPTNESAAFYLLPFRAWELLIGSAIAVGAVPRIEHPLLREAAAALGLFMLAWAVFVFTSETPFPGVAALLPTLGSALIIHAGGSGQTWVGRALSLRPIVFVGLISYSLYLWHWPVAVYVKGLVVNELGGAEKTAVVIVSFALAILSWKFVETPFRRRRVLSAPTGLIAGFSTAMVGFVVVGLGIALADGFPARGTGGDYADIIASDPGWAHWKACEELGERNEENPEFCTIGSPGAGKRFLFWGDSHALALATAVNLSANRTNAAGWLAVRTGCPPLRNIDRPGSRSCARFNEAVLRFVAQQPNVDTVVLAARWALSTTGTRYKAETGRRITLVDLATAGDRGNEELVERGLDRTIRLLRELRKDVIVVSQVPEIGHDVPAANYVARLTGRSVDEMIAPLATEFRERAGAAQRIIESLAAQHEARVLHPAERLCGSHSCRIVDSGVPLYRDDNHLSLAGCVLVSDLFDSVLPANQPSP